MSIHIEFGKDQLVVYRDVKDALVSRYEAQVCDVVLQSRENLKGRAHGADGVVSRQAVGDGDVGFGHVASRK